MTQLDYRVEPHAASQLREVLVQSKHNGPLLFAVAGLTDWWEEPPVDMIHETDAASLHQTIWRHLPDEHAREVLREAGLRMADHLMAVRIGKATQIVLHYLPARLSAALLLRAIEEHAWSIIGSGKFAASCGQDVEISVTSNPFCRHQRADQPVCVWHEAIFERLFSKLVSRRVQVRETSCCGNGDSACRFSVRW